MSRLAGGDKLANVLAFKLLGLAYYYAVLGLIALTLLRRAPHRAMQGVCLFALNPLVIYETAGNGHNDIVMVFWLTLALCAAAHNRYVLAGVAATAGALVKFVPALILPIVLAAGLRAQTSRRARLRYLGVTLLACAALFLAAYAPFYQGGDIFAIQRRSGLFTASLPAMIQAQLEPSLGVGESRRLVREGAVLLTGVVMLLAVWRTWVEAKPLAPASSRTPSPGEAAAWLAPLRASTFVFLVYLLFTCLWFQPWYALWPLALAALLPEGESGRLAVLLSYAAVWKTIVFDFFLVPDSALPPRIWRETLLAPATLGLVWLYGLYAAAVKLRQAEFGIPKLFVPRPGAHQ